MSNSNLVSYKRLSPNYSKRTKKITTITPHIIAGNISLQSLGNIFAPRSRNASSNYGIDNLGRVGMYVEEHNRAWTSGSASNDHKAITIEVANSAMGGNWPVSERALEGLVKLSVDICRRNGISKLEYTKTPSGTITRHNMFQSTVCPGKYLQSKLPYLEKEVNRRLQGKPPIKIEGAYKKNYYNINSANDKEGVRKLQRDLERLGYSVGRFGADGIFGKGTKKAVEEFQSKNKLVVDGSAGPATLRKLKNNPISKNSTKPIITNKIKVDGYWGKETTRALQKYLGTTEDGYLSGQYPNGVTRQISSATFNNRRGSTTVKKLQKRIGVRVDGYLGVQTIRALQKYLGTPIDGHISRPSLVVKKMQKQLNNNNF